MTLQYKTGSFWQTVLVGALFVGSVATLFFNSVTAFLLPGKELAIRELLREASGKLASTAASEIGQLGRKSNRSLDRLNNRLEEMTRQGLKGYPGVEGGFYLSDSRDEFAGYAFPTEQRRGPKHDVRRDPPPKEEPYIRLQAKQTAIQDETEPLIQSRDVGPSRVIVATTPVGTARPAAMVVWLMYRVTGPEQYRQQVSRYQVSTVLALAGIVAALLIMLNLRRTLQQERRARDRLHDELRRSEHLASLGLMVAQVAHELRNPLAGIRSTVQLWQRLPEQSQTPESMQAVVGAVDRLDALLTNLLQFSRSETTDRGLFDLNAVVRETIQLLTVQAAEQRVVMELELESKLPQVSGSTSGFRQVVLNLAMNALQAMPHAGRLNCRTNWNAVRSEVELEIADTGPGIDAAVRSRLFEPFFTTRAHGTGLGLALCREIVVQHGGRIDLEVVVPHGSLFRVVLPVLTSAENRPSPQI